MSREWAPGDVALVNGRVCIRTTIARWEHGDNQRFAYPGDAEARPLVVIDPQDMQAVERLQDCYIAAERQGLSGLSMQAALREFADPTPPKPEEPTGLGAVVEDSDGNRWIRAARIAHGWHRPMGTWSNWSGINAVRVLSEGVPS